jgi:chemotaxis protein histidine kinase CheA
LTNPVDIENLAKKAVLVDEEDLPALVDLYDRVRSVIPDLDSRDLSSVVDCLEHTAALLQQIVYREAQDASQALDMVRRGIEFAQRAVAADDEGRPISEVGASPFGDNTAATPDPIDAELLASWIGGCASGLTDLENIVVGLDGGSAAAAEVVAEVRRRLHTLKGECGVLSLHQAQKLWHHAESAVDECIERSGPAPAQLILELIDWMRSYVTALGADPRAVAPDHADLLARLTAAAGRAVDAGVPTSAGLRASNGVAATPTVVPDHPRKTPLEDGTPVDLSFDPSMQDSLGEFLTEAREHLANSEHALLELEKDPGNKELVNTVFRAFHTIKGVAGFLNLAPVVSLAHSAEFLLDGVRSDRLTLGPGNLNLVLRSCDLMAQMARALDSGGQAPTTGQLRGLVDDLERATRGETPTEAAPTPEREPRKAEPADASGPPQAQASAESSSKRTEQTVKVSTSRMDALIDMVGELVIAQQMVIQDPSVRGLREQRVNRNLAMVGKIIRDLQEVSMSLRMVPVKATFQKMARLVRDVSAKAGKKHLAAHRGRGRRARPHRCRGHRRSARAHDPQRVRPRDRAGRRVTPRASPSPATSGCGRSIRAGRSSSRCRTTARASTVTRSSRRRSRRASTRRTGR